MTDQQAIEVLRALSNPMRLTGQQYGVRVHEAAGIGADAIEFNAWLFEPNPRGVLRMFNLWYGWNQQGDFRDYAEAQWRAIRG